MKGIRLQITRCLSSLRGSGGARCRRAALAAGLLALAGCGGHGDRHARWAWLKGADSVDHPGVYGRRAVASPDNVPGARQAQVTWVDGHGNLWLFGGIGYDAIGTFSYLNDLWKYSTATGEWTWMGGAKRVNEAGHYGTRNVPGRQNMPGARRSAVTWHDRAGNLWLFGGYGADAHGTLGYLNDLWKYNPKRGQWVWVSGATAVNRAGHYGVRDRAAMKDVPGARTLAAAWTDGAGNLWLFGGTGYDSTGSLGNLADLWKFSPATGRWTWVAGAPVVNQAGSYGLRGVDTADNAPGARQAALAWTDAAHHFWLFGGIGYDAHGTLGNLNDLWRYTPKTNTWVWVGGAARVNQPGRYGIRARPARANVPGARYLSVTWTDAAGDLWLFGGARARANGGFDCLNDMWKYDPASGEWTWMGGASTPHALGRYPARGAARATAAPGARQASALWAGADGRLWLFGGFGRDALGNRGDLNDLWRYRPD